MREILIAINATMAVFWLIGAFLHDDDTKQTKYAAFACCHMTVLIFLQGSI